MNENETKKLSRTDLFSMAIGQIIGVGIMTHFSLTKKKEL